MAELLLSKQNQIGLKRQASRAKASLKISEHTLTAQCEAYLTQIEATFVRIPDAVYRAIFGGHTIKPYIKALVSRFLKGIPDFVILKRHSDYDTSLTIAHALCIELKTDIGKQSQGQKAFAKKIPVMVIRDFESFKDAVDYFLR